LGEGKGDSFFSVADDGVINVWIMQHPPASSSPSASVPPYQEHDYERVAFQHP
jgi:hypothetical protein